MPGGARIRSTDDRPISDPVEAGYMKNVTDLIESAARLSSEGLSKGEIADELNVSRETASWLVARSSDAPQVSTTGTGPDDIHVDWSPIGESSARLAAAGRALADLLAGLDAEADLVLGIEKAGAPLATTVARELEVDLATFTPPKHHWEGSGDSEFSGSFSQNFSPVEGRNCFVVDDTITSGTTLTETVEAVREEGGTPVACGVLVDKRGTDSIDDVPVEALIRVIRVGE